MKNDPDNIPNSRQAARTAKSTVYYGKDCKKCNHNLRETKSGKCVKCITQPDMIETKVETVKEFGTVIPFPTRKWIVACRETRKEWGPFDTRALAGKAYYDLKSELGGVYIIKRL